VDKPENPFAFAACEGIGFQDGMTLRDYFAGQAIGAVINTCVSDPRREGESIEQYFARKAGEIADAMLSERSKNDGK
jgi:hypothetical protein